MIPSCRGASTLVNLLVGLLVLAALAAGVWFLGRALLPHRNDPDNPDVHRFPGVAGPAGVAAVAEPVPADWRSYDEGSPSRLAILLTDEDSDWLGLAHGLKSIGVPFRITRDVGAALAHRVVLVYPTISGRVLPPEELRALARFPEGGGTLVGFGVEGGGLERVFGFARAEASAGRRELRLDPGFAVTAEFTDERELTVRVNVPGADAAVSLLAYVVENAAALARYDDGAVAVTQRRIGPGTAYAFGVDVGFLLLKGYNRRQEGLARSYVNQFEPTLDVFLRLLRNIYAEGEARAVTLHPVPDNRSLAAIMTHDVDYTGSMANMAAYAAMERSLGVPATYFIQTKYVRDWNDDVFFNDAAPAALAQLRAAGMEIASHSVAHSLQFARFPLGTGGERYPEYKPFVRTKGDTLRGTILGELRVSKFLLEHFSPGTEVVSFRPGHLENPLALPQAMAATGYRYSSAVAANNVLTHLPYRLTYGRDKRAQTGIYEFPIAIEDEHPPRLGERLDAALAVADRVARYGGPFIVLIHTDVTGHKLEFERRLITALRDRAWFGTLGDFGGWWVARDRVGVDVAEAGDRVVVTLRAPEAVDGLTLSVPAGWRLETDAAAETIRQDGRRVTLARVEGSVRLEFSRRPDSG